jgi:hypothetical protein
LRTAAQIQDELTASGALLVAKAADPVMRLIGLVLGQAFMEQFWTTYRLPFCAARICYPSCVKLPGARTEILDHELVHVRQFAPWWGPLAMLLGATLFPLPSRLSGRWFIERRAYLRDIQEGRMTPGEAVDILWNYYAKPWPRAWMLAWFQRELAAK